MNNFSQLEALIRKNYSNTGGLIALKDGKLVLEQYFNGQNVKTKNHIFSATKSIVSILMGIAIDKGFIADENQKILDFFPDYSVPEKNKAIRDITIRDMLTMTAPYCYIFPNYPKYFTSNDWVQSSLEQLGGKKPIVRINEKEATDRQKKGSARCPFHYAGIIGPDILSGILVKATGKSVLDFANEHLFGFLEIDVKNSIVFSSKEDQMLFYKTSDHNGWVAAQNGIHTAGWGLNLTAHDMAKLGQLYLDGGVFNGKQIVSKSWIEKSTYTQSYCSKFKLEYGYWWWLLDKDSFAAMGDGGNMLYINRAKNIVIATTAIMVPRAKLRIDLIKKVIEPLC